MRRFAKAAQVGLLGAVMLVFAGCELAQQAVEGLTETYESAFCSTLRSACTLVPGDCKAKDIYANCF